VPELRALGPTTGLVHVSSIVSAEILRAFSLCFALAAVAAGLCVALWLRSLPLGLLSVLPNVLPITAVGSLMWLTGIPLDFTSGIALTIAFGIAVDDTVHLINRIRSESHGSDWTEASVLAALRGIGPTLVMTSAILIGGISSTVLSSLPSLATFGALTIAVFCLALVADLLLLPALFVWHLRRRARRTQASPVQT
jgi:Predicted exporters of the RND superfamily